jgi:uncharacterized protein (DUF433 family)
MMVAVSVRRGGRMIEEQLLQRITFNPEIFGGKPIVRGRRLAVEHVLAMMAAGDSVETILEGYPWLEPEDIQACLAYARRSRDLRPGAPVGRADHGDP